MRFELTILGCSGAVPAYGRFPTQQLLNVNDQLYMIDCGEGAQMRFSDYGVRWGKLGHIFISHHHGDHVLGLPGLLSSMGLNCRTAPLRIFGPAEVGRFLESACAFLGSLSYEVDFCEVDPERHALVHEDKRVQVFSLPLQHSARTSGYLFREKERPRHMKAPLIKQYQIPYSAIPGIKAGAGFDSPVHGFLPNEELTSPAALPRSFAFCSDTRYAPSLIPYIKGVDLLYHEGTFLEAQRQQAEETSHSTARQAARVALSADARQLVLGHYSTRYYTLGGILQEACAVFPNSLLGFDGLTVPVPLRYPSGPEG